MLDNALQGRMCLMLGPPGSGKSSLLKILAGKIKDSKLVKVGLPNLTIDSGCKLSRFPV